MGESVVAPLPTPEVTPEQEKWFEELLGEERPISPTSEKYKVKYQYLQEKFDHVEEENSILRRRVQAVKKEVMKMMQMKRSLCGLLDEKGDQWYRSSLEINDEDPITTFFDLNPLKDFAPLRMDSTDGTPKRKSRPSGGRSRAKAKVKDAHMTPEQREEEERAKAKIVSIIDSVFSETAKKNAKTEEEMKKKLASVSRETAGKVLANQAAQEKFYHSPASGSTAPAERRNQEEANIKKKTEPPPFIPYKIFANDNVKQPPAKKPRQAANGVIAGISYSYTPHEEPPPVNAVPGPSTAQSQACG